MTKKELLAAIEALGGTGNMRMLKDELTYIYEELLHATQETNTIQEGEIQMTNTNGIYTPYAQERSKKLTKNMARNIGRPVTNNQQRYFDTMLRNYDFPDVVKSFVPRDMAEMSKALDRMNTMIHSGEVSPIPREVVEKELSSVIKAMDREDASSNQVTDRQIEAIKALAIETGKCISVPRTKKEASELISTLRMEVSSESVAATIEPEDKPLGFFKRLLQRLVG